MAHKTKQTTTTKKAVGGWGPERGKEKKDEGKGPK